MRGGGVEDRKGRGKESARNCEQRADACGGWPERWKDHDQLNCDTANTINRYELLECAHHTVYKVVVARKKRRHDESESLVVLDSAAGENF